MTDEGPFPAPSPAKRRSVLGVWTMITAMLAVTGLQQSSGVDGAMTGGRVNAINGPEGRPAVGPVTFPAATPGMPFRWASSAATDVADNVGTEMECRALHVDEEKGGGYPTAALESMVEGSIPPFNPDFLVKNKDSQL